MSGSEEQQLNKQPWFHGLLPREEVKLLLVNVGDYLVRRSEPSPGKARHVILSLLQNQADPEGSHYVIISADGRFSVTEKESFSSFTELLDHHKTNPINEAVASSVLVNPILRQSWELNHDDITMTKTLGEGAFGEVRAGMFKSTQGSVNVAIKVAKLEKCTKEQIREITTEARLMRRFDHKNVVRCYGVAAIEEPLLVVMELVQGGGLDSYLSKNQVPMSEKIDIIVQVASGLAYIHSQNIMHRDIAARNVLYGNGIAKVSDFGLSRIGTSYQMHPEKKAPIRWLAPETMTTLTYTQATDVFAFAILCWEVLEDGAEPYPGLMVIEVRNKVVNDDYRMTINEKAPPNLQELIKKCWLRDVNARPTMEQAKQMVMGGGGGGGGGPPKKDIAAKMKGGNGRGVAKGIIEKMTSRVDKTGRRNANRKKQQPSTCGNSKQSLSLKVPQSPAVSDGKEEHKENKKKKKKV